MKSLYERGRKIPFENVVRNLRLGRYTKTGIDYANTGVNIFLETKFADNLGVSIEKLFKIGLLKKGDENGWKLTKIPDYKHLMAVQKLLTL